LIINTNTWTNQFVLEFIRFNTYQEKNKVRDTILLEQKDLSVLKIGAPYCVRCPRPYNSESATLGNSRTRSAIIHWTVR
jgi:hypothetical protein